jgi:hypothetical protein
MLTSLEIENFKGIAARQRIDFAPLTLLFGANSAGKSTILQALLYLHELIERGAADVDHTELGGGVLELGGFARVVHRHDTERVITLRAEFATPGSIERFGRDLTNFPFPDLDDEVESAWFELTVAYRKEGSHVGPMIESVTVGVSNHVEPLVWVDTVGSLRPGDPLYFRVNLAHPTIRAVGLELRSSWEELSVPEPLWHRGLDPASGEYVIGLDDVHVVDDQYGRMPLFAVSRSRVSAVPPLNEPLHILVPDEADVPENQQALRDVQAFLEMTVLGTISQLSAFLSSSIYIGPLRTVPPRGFLYERAGRVTNWADGLAAWDLLLADRFTLVEQTNLWLSRLGSGCQLVVQQLFDQSADAEEISVGHVDKTVRRLLLDTGGGSLVLPSEVGAGVSQIIPVIVAALEGSAGLALVEQPEIHIHPAMQVGLGDLFIEAVTSDAARRRLLIETHSEHIILRLLRRIREATDKVLKEDALAFSESMLSVLYVESTSEGVSVRRLRVDEQGEFVDRWPKGFFAERMEELL